MTRPTALIRRLLVLEAFRNYLSSEIVRLKEQMNDEDIKIISKKDNVHDIWIEYKHENQYDKAIYMMKMLEAETLNRAKRSGLLS